MRLLLTKAEKQIKTNSCLIRATGKNWHRLYFLYEKLFNMQKASVILRYLQYLVSKKQTPILRHRPRSFSDVSRNEIASYKFDQFSDVQHPMRLKDDCLSVINPKSEIVPHIINFLTFFLLHKVKIMQKT